MGGGSKISISRFILSFEACVLAFNFQNLPSFISRVGEIGCAGLWEEPVSPGVSTAALLLGRELCGFWGDMVHLVRRGRVSLCTWTDVSCLWPARCQR